MCNINLYCKNTGEEIGNCKFVCRNNLLMYRGDQNIGRFKPKRPQLYNYQFKINDSIVDKNIMYITHKTNYHIIIELHEYIEDNFIQDHKFFGTSSHTINLEAAYVNIYNAIIKYLSHYRHCQKIKSANS